MKMLLIVPLLLLSLPLPWGAHELAGVSGTHAATAHQTPSPSTPSVPVHVVEGTTELPTPCGMVNCLNMVGCTGAGTAVGARAANLMTSTVAAPDDPTLVLAFQTAPRTAVPPPPRS